MVVKIFRCPIHRDMPHKLLTSTDDTPRCSICRTPLEVIEYGLSNPPAGGGRLK